MPWEADDSEFTVGFLFVDYFSQSDIPWALLDFKVLVPLVEWNLATCLGLNKTLDGLFWVQWEYKVVHRKPILSVDQAQNLLE